MRLNYETPPEGDRRPPRLRYPVVWTALAVVMVGQLLFHLLSRLAANTDPMAVAARAVVAVAAVTTVYAAVVQWARYRRSAARFRSP